MTDQTKPTPQQVLDLPLPDNDSGANAVRGYLVALLETVWDEGEGFSGKRPFGNSSWEYDLYVPMVKAGWVRGSFDEHGYVDDLDTTTGRGLVVEAIRALGQS